VPDVSPIVSADASEEIDAPEPGRVVECINPSATDSAIRRFDSPHYIAPNTARPHSDIPARPAVGAAASR